MKGHGRRLPRWAPAVAMLTMLACAGMAHASYMSGDQRIEAASTVTVQNTFHHNSINDIEWAQWRNEFRFDLRYFLLPQGVTAGPINNVRFNMLYRARYDAVYDLVDRYKKRGYQRDDFRFPEGKIPRELFFDVSFTEPIDGLSLRLGKQQVVWGEADLFRSLDVINPLRLDQNGLIGEDFDDYREPLWIAKALYSIGPVPFVAENSYLEAFWSPNWRPLTDRILVSEAFRIGVDQNYCPSADGCPSGSPTFNSPTFRRPNILPWRMVRAPWEVTRVGTHRTDAPDQADLAPAPGCADGPQGLRCGDFVYLLQNGVPTNVLDVDTSMFGFRFGGQTFAGLDFTLNYIFKKSEVPGTALRVSDLFDPARPSDENGNMNNFRTGAEADDAVGPDDHYSLARAAADLATPDNDGNGVPDGQDAAVGRCIYEQKPTIILKGLHGPHYNFDDQTNTAYETVNGATGCEMVGFWYPWTHIIGGTLTYNDFDYTGFIWRVEQSYSTKEPRNGAPPLAGPRAGNFPATRDFESHGKRTTGAWRSMIGFDYLRTIYPKPPPWIRSRKWLSTWLTDQWFFTFQFFNEYYPHVDGQIGLLDSVTDRMQHYNPVLTYVMTGFFMNQKLRPFWAYGYDVNAQTHVAWLQMQYFLTNKFAIRFGDIMYMGSKDAESFLFLHKYADRDNLFVRLEYYLL